MPGITGKAAAIPKGARGARDSPSVTKQTFDTSNQGIWRYVFTSSSDTELLFENGVEVEGEMRMHDVFTHALWTGLRKNFPCLQLFPSPYRYVSEHSMSLHVVFTDIERQQRSK